MRLVLSFFLFMTLTVSTQAATFEAVCKTKTSLREQPLVTRIKLVQRGIVWLGETVIAGAQADRLFVNLHETQGEITFDAFVRRDNKIVGASDTETLWRDEDPMTGYPVVDNPEASAHIVLNDNPSGAQTVVDCSIQQD